MYVILAAKLCCVGNMNNLVRRGQRLQTWRKMCTKHYSVGSEESRESRKIVFNDLIRQRQAEATRSIVVQVSSEKSFSELYNYCSIFGKIVSAHHYRINHDEELHYILLEFSKAEEASVAIASSTYHDDQAGVPARSSFLWFKAAGKRLQNAAVKNQIDGNKLNAVQGTDIMEAAKLNDLLQKTTNIESQIHLLHQNTKLNDLGVRLRFLAALQLQQAVSGMFPAANVQPFGSSVNGFGRMGCDLDLILRFDRELIGEEVQNKQHKDSRLVFHTKDNLNNGRSQIQRQMESIGDMLHLFLPGVCNVRRILQARVPIIKFHHEHLDLEVDLSMSNLTGYYMSELLYMFGEYDERVRPLIFCVRCWASACGLTNSSPGRWISNFSLTCLVIFFLQQLKQPILPAISALMKKATTKDIRLTEDGINCTFSRDFEHIGFHTSNTLAINELLLQFYEFYSQFDFNNRAISLNEGRAIAKPDHSALYIVNPLEQVLNVSKNVSHEECERLRIEVRNAAWILESEVENTNLIEDERYEAPWGLLNLFRTTEKTVIRPNMFFKPRMVDVSELFDKSLELQQQQQQQQKKQTTVSFKNDIVKQQVKNIKSQARSDLKQMRTQASSASHTDCHSSRHSR